MATAHSRMLILTYDATDPAIDHRLLKAFLRHMPGTLNWWHHLPGVFLVVTELDAEAFSDLLRPRFSGAKFLVMAVDPDRSEGQLPERAWSWIKKRSSTTADERA